MGILNVFEGRNHGFTSEMNVFGICCSLLVSCFGFRFWSSFSMLDLPTISTKKPGPRSR